jgi:WD40 repeat protein
MISAAYAPAGPVPPPAPAALLWADPVNTNAIALSANGRYVVVATPGGVSFYGRSSSTPLWTYSLSSFDYTSVAISADGSYVAAASFDPQFPQGRVLFWADAQSLTTEPHNPGTPDPTWSSASLNGPLERRCLAISADGNAVAACGTGPSVFYWAGATGRTASNELTTWDYNFGFLVEAIAISPDGNYVAAVNSGGYVGYWKNAKSLTGRFGSQLPAWSGREAGEVLVDVAISNDGNYVAAAGVGGVHDTMYYWAGALTRSTETESHTWSGGESVGFLSIDMSSSGYSVVAGAEDGVYFWGGARGLTGTPTQTWKYSTTSPAYDVAIDSAGDYMAACTASFATLYLFDNTGSLKWSYEIGADKVSISSDGATLAVGTPTTRTAYLLKTGFQTAAPIGAPVGGFLEPVNKLTVFAPYFALFGAIAAVAVVFVKPWKRDN